MESRMMPVTSLPDEKHGTIAKLQISPTAVIPGKLLIIEDKMVLAF